MIPVEFSAMAQAIQELEPAILIADSVAGQRRVLNVGPSWGRDYYALTQRGHRVFNLDIALQTHLPQTILANVAHAIPFPDQTFNAVLLPEVLEHIWNDFDALREARRVLKDDGRLVVTIPFYSDAPEYHVRVHSGKTILRLLQANGFAPLDYVERGGLVSFPRLIHATRKLFRLVGRGDAFAHWVIRVDTWLGHRRLPLRRWLNGYGCVVVPRKDRAVDYTQLNATEFRHSREG
ncbi:MAG: class I SAM-dependent methyltransferase [Chloroflexi bacterium]|nr:class I SAM-dependent methyltransferase [Chloroflexota bacterium]